jgi:hypothetical protein
MIADRVFAHDQVAKFCFYFADLGFVHPFHHLPRSVIGEPTRKTRIARLMHPKDTHRAPNENDFADRIREPSPQRKLLCHS